MPTRAIVVTGGAEGIGRAVVLLCAARGDRIAVLDRSADKAGAAAEEAERRGAGSAFSLPCDVADEEQVAQAFAAVAERFGPPYGLFTSAAVDVGGLVHELPSATWRQVLDTNLSGTFYACKHALKAMREAGTPGSIVCASSPTGFVALAAGGTAVYSASNGGVSSLVRCLAVD